jgi:hypothetical protein
MDIIAMKKVAQILIEIGIPMKKLGKMKLKKNKNGWINHQAGVIEIPNYAQN